MQKSSELYDEFLGIYNEIDHHMRRVLQDTRKTEHGYLIDEFSRKSAIVARHAHDLRVFAQLRNVLVHNPFTKIANPIAMPDPNVVAHYRQIRDALLHPPTATSISVPVAKLFTCELDDTASDIVRKMSEYTYTHVPVMSDGKMIGVFSENSLLNYLAFHKDVVLTKDSKVREFEDFISLDAHKGERFVFIERKAPISEVYDVFNSAIKKHERIGAMFLTEHGSKDEKILGLITAWDLALPEILQKV